MPMSRTYILMVTLHFAVVIASGVFLWMGKFLGKRIVNLIQTIESLKEDLAPFKVMAHLTFEDLCARKPEMRGVLQAMTTEQSKSKGNGLDVNA